MLKLICGPSGSGKTEILIDSIRKDIENGVRSFLLIPEQQAYISERDIPAKLPENAGLYFETVNFSRLAEDVFRKFGGVTKPTVSGGVRTLLMWNTLRTLSPMLSQYGKYAAEDTAMTALMLQTLSELRAGGVDGSLLEDAAQKLDPASPLAKKLNDLALIDAAYRSALESCCEEDTEDKLMRLSKVLKEHRFFGGCHVYIDSFTSFTVPEYAVLLEIVKQADCVSVTLCADTFFSRLPHFQCVAETAKKLYKLANAANSEVEKLLLSSREDSIPPVLRILERDLWNFSIKKSQRCALAPCEGDAVRLFSASNVYEEAEAAAMHICELVQDGMHYGDIAVVVRDTESYRGILDAAFERYNIPFFLSERTDFSSKPLSRLILSALRAVSHNYRQADMITLLKTGLCGIDLKDAALFEEYCQTWHIGGKRFFDEVWSMNPDGLTTDRSPRAEEILAAANRVRQQLVTPLLSLSAELKASKRMIDRCKALYNYLCRLNIAHLLSERASKELALGRRRDASETLRLYAMSVEILTTLSGLMPEEEVTTEEFLSALGLMFASFDMGSIPNTHDCVVIGSASTLRVENVRASLLLGLCEGEFPRAISDDGVLTEADKDTLETLGVSISSRSALRSSEELLYVYRAIAKPREKLSLFTVAQEIDGSTRTPSLAFSRVAFLLDRTPEEFHLDEIRRAEADPEESEAEKLKALPMSPHTSLRLSQSRIQAFVLCPYRYYNTYRLRLRETKDSTPSYADDGVFMHYVFEHFLKSSIDENGALHLPSVEDTEKIADNIIERYLAQVSPFSFDLEDSRLLHLYARLRKLSILMLKEILMEIRTSQFVPYRFEQGIGTPGENSLPPVKIGLANGATVILSGKIDRVDLWRNGDQVYLRVVDYKSGKHTFSLDEVRTGMDIQLVLYLFAVLNAQKDALPAGAEYLFASTEKGQTEIKRSGFYLDEEQIKSAMNGESDQFYTKKLLGQSLDGIQALEADMKTAVSAVAERILAGEADKTPSEEACAFCPVRSHCNKAYHK